MGIGKNVSGAERYSTPCPAVCPGKSFWGSLGIVFNVVPHTVSHTVPHTVPHTFRYRVSEGIQVPFKVIPAVKELGRTRVEANVNVRSTFGSKLFAMNVVVLVPVPDYTAKANILVTTGKAKYDAIRKSIVSRGRWWYQLTDARALAQLESADIDHMHEMIGMLPP
jgi:AP-2 complex subunit mu-1